MWPGFRSQIVPAEADPCDKTRAFVLRFGSASGSGRHFPVACRSTDPPRASTAEPLRSRLLGDGALRNARRVDFPPARVVLLAGQFLGETRLVAKRRRRALFP